MATEATTPGSRFVPATLRWLRIFTLNLWRRLSILGRYTIICFHQQRLRRAWRLLGRQLHQTVAAGEVNPMLTEEVQDRLARAEVIKETKDRHYQAIAALRQKIRDSRRSEALPPEEAGSAAGETPVGTAGGSEEGRD